jgi:membrane protein YqaA with SNARE-associated domain
MLRLLLLEGWLARAGETLRGVAMSLGASGMFVVAVMDSSFLSIPEGNDLLIVILSTGKTWERMAYYVLMTSLGSVVGCLLLYTVGRKGGSPLLRRRFSPRTVERAEVLFRRYGLLTIAIPSLLPPPFPFKIFVLSAGVFRVGLPGFVTAVVLGRTVRYSMWGILAVLYGTSVKTYMQQNLPRIGLMLVAVFAVAIIAALAVRIYRVRRARDQARL